MLQFLRHTGRTLAAVLLAGSISQAALAAPTVSNSGNFSFEILTATYLSGSFAVEVVAEGANGFRIQRAGGGPLVPFGNDLFLEAFVTPLGGNTISSWTGELIGASGGSMGEQVFDISQTLGLGIINVTGVSPYGQIHFSPQAGGLFIEKDINGTLGEVIAVVQSVAVPAPFSLAILGSGLLGLALVRRRRATDA